MYRSASRTDDRCSVRFAYFGVANISRFSDLFRNQSQPWKKTWKRHCFSDYLPCGQGWRRKNICQRILSFPMQPCGICAGKSPAVWQRFGRFPALGLSNRRNMGRRLSKKLQHTQQKNRQTNNGQLQRRQNQWNTHLEQLQIFQH